MVIAMLPGLGTLPVRCGDFCSVGAPVVGNTVRIGVGTPNNLTDGFIEVCGL